ncbi:MAG TPA: hypothetical protein VMG82_10510 [Candidatus Sulfotelmatobacter sp.]|nr:hypothetical protein [Candidatus Sulfotelmatobacter sp.]
MQKKLVCLCTVVFLLVSVVTSAQVGEQFRTLVINDKSGKVAVLQMGDKTYIDLKRLVQIADGSISYEGNRITLDVSCESAPAPATAEIDQASSTLLSREFMKAAIEEISLMREWASTLANAIQNGYPISESSVADYRAQAQSGLAMASTAVSTDADRSGLQLLNGEFEHVQAWSTKLMEARKSMDTAKYAISPDTLRNDPLSQKIVSCGRFLAQMLVSGNFRDDPSCH